MISAIGWYRQRRWGWALSVLIIATQVAGDFVNLLRGEFLQGVAGSG